MRGRMNFSSTSDEKTKDSSKLSSWPQCPQKQEEKTRNY